uniref:GGDEF domain-containing protein n=1 Tax=Fervidobacterium thailandense TaxID=1008305 RepID=A0A7C4W3V3_9BACT
MLTLGVTILNKKEIIFVLTCFTLGALFFALSTPFVVNTNWYLIVPAIFMLFIAQNIYLYVGTLRFTMRSFATQYLLLFMNPESIALITVLLIVLSTKNWNLYLKRVAFEVVQLGLGTLMYKLAPSDYLRLLFFSVGYYFANQILSFLSVLFLSQEVFLNHFERFFKSFAVTFGLGLYGAGILSTALLFEYANFVNMFVVTLLYAGYLFILIYTVKSEVWRMELDFEKEKLHWEVDHLKEVIEVHQEVENGLDINKAIGKMLAVACNVMGFEYALLNLFDFRERKVVRIANYGLPEEVFERLKVNRPSLTEALVLLQQRFDVGGAYFIPKGSVDLSDSYVYTPQEYVKVDVENAWDPEDLFLVPLLYRGKIVGYVSYDKPKTGLRPTKREVELAKFFSWQLMSLIQKSPLVYFVQKESIPHVGFAKFWEDVSKLISQEKSFVLILMDIDDFEEYNLRNGFKLGDELISTTEKFLSEVLENLGFYTFSGDEFLVCLHSNSKTDGLLLAERVMSELKARGFAVSLSSSVAKFPSDGSTVEELVEKLKVALRTVKKSGGGRAIGV